MLARRLVNVARSARVSVAAPSMRYFSDEPLTIPTDRDQQGGRRKEELEAYERGEEAFDHRRSLVPPDDAGTKENPIMVGLTKRYSCSSPCHISTGALLNHKTRD